MGSLLDEYKAILETNDERKHCFYYDEQRLKKYTFESRAKDFILEYFEVAHKDLSQDEKLISDWRFEHTKSAFLLGIFIYNNIDDFRKAIDNQLAGFQQKAIAEDPSYSRQEPRRVFLYFWFLCCLYHDVGYIYEELGESKPQYYNEFLDIIQNKSFDNYCEYKCLEEIASEKGIPLCYIEKYKDYFLCKANNTLFGKYKGLDSLCIDHGYAGGLRLFKGMMKKHCYKEDGTKREHCELVNGLRFGPTIFDNIILPCVWTIIAHNIWFATTQDSADKYEGLGLEQLIIYKRMSSPINYTEHSLLFLLCLVDVLEPIKLLFKESSTMDSGKIRNIDISANEKELIVNYENVNELYRQKHGFTDNGKSRKNSIGYTINDNLAFLKAKSQTIKQKNNIITVYFK